MALLELRRAGREPAVLLTTVDEESGRVPHHGIPRDLLRAQARAAGMPLAEVEIPPRASNASYEDRLRAAFASSPLDAVGEVAFGDLFLADLRAYRESRMADAGLKASFPLWGRDTAALAREVVDGGVQAVVTSVDPERGDRAWLGRHYDHAFLDELPAGVDPCGEHGEFHTFVFDGPALLHSVQWSAAGIRERDGFPYLDLR